MSALPTSLPTQMPTLPTKTTLVDSRFLLVGSFRRLLAVMLAIVGGFNDPQKRCKSQLKNE
jgi:hypothetical protein